MSMDPEVIGKVVVDGVLLKLGDLILMHSPGLVKKGFVVTVVVIFRRVIQKAGGKRCKKHSEST